MLYNNKYRKATFRVQRTTVEVKVIVARVRISIKMIYKIMLDEQIFIFLWVVR